MQPSALPPLIGPYGRDALTFASQFAGHGANAAWFHGFDPTAFELCERHGIAPCVEFATFRADFNARPELIPIGVDGQPIRFGALVQGVCLSQQAFLDQIEADLRAGLRAFKPTGIWLDYLTYAGWFETPEPDLQDSCFCAACIADFCQATGIDATTPAEILRTAGAAWARHKCERVARLAGHYAALIRQHAPACIIGAYMCPWTPAEFDRALTRIFAQDYDLLAPAIDVFTPLIYVAKSGRTAAWGREFLEQAPAFVPQDRPVQLILDALDFPDSLLAMVESPHPSWGFQLFGGAAVFGDPERARIFASAARRLQGQ